MIGHCCLLIDDCCSVVDLRYNVNTNFAEILFKITWLFNTVGKSMRSGTPNLDVYMSPIPTIPNRYIGPTMHPSNIEQTESSFI